jgi:hypothetical protein
MIGTMSRRSKTSGCLTRITEASLGAPHLGICCETKTHRAVRFSSLGLRGWASKIHMPKGSLAQSIVSVFTT